MAAFEEIMQSLRGRRDTGFANAAAARARKNQNWQTTLDRLMKSVEGGLGRGHEAEQNRLDRELTASESGADRALREKLEGLAQEGALTRAQLPKNINDMKQHEMVDWLWDQIASNNPAMWNKMSLGEVLSKGDVEYLKEIWSANAAIFENMGQYDNLIGIFDARMARYMANPTPIEDDDEVGRGLPEQEYAGSEEARQALSWYEAYGKIPDSIIDSRAEMKITLDPTKVDDLYVKDTDNVALLTYLDSGEVPVAGESAANAVKKLQETLGTYSDKEILFETELESMTDDELVDEVEGIKENLDPSEESVLSQTTFLVNREQLQQILRDHKNEWYLEE